MENKIYTSKELFNKLNEVRENAEESIVSIMKSRNLTSIDLTMDDEGRTNDDEDYNDDFFYENRVWAECYGKYGNEQGYVTEIKLSKKGDHIIFEAEGEEGSYPNDYIGHYADLYVYTLELIELYISKKTI